MKAIYKVLIAIYQFFIAALLASIGISLVNAENSSHGQGYGIFAIIFILGSLLFMIFSFTNGGDASSYFKQELKREKEEQTSTSMNKK
jgi:ABC-type transport system involved in cytochrome c biogenesis permease subunit